jgi:uncharacterized protein (DUF433 family)
MSSVSVEHIEKSPGKCAGKACIVGHRIRVADIVVWHEKRNRSPEEILELFPGITLADVHAALTYYFDNRQEIEDDFRESDRLSESLKAEVPSKIPEKFRARPSD